jgi:hypothetical protein
MITMDELNRLIKSRKSMPASELDELLHSCPEWVAQNAAREAKRAEAEAKFRIEEEPIIADLAAAGFEVGSVWDLVNTNAKYPAALPVLLNHLRHTYHQRIREGIIRALTVKEARGIAGEAILDELRGETDSENRWALANALTVTAERKDAAAIKALLADPAFEDVGERLGEALSKIS